MFDLWRHHVDIMKGKYFYQILIKSVPFSYYVYHEIILNSKNKPVDYNMPYFEEIHTNQINREKPNLTSEKQSVILLYNSYDDIKFNKK